MSQKGLANSLKAVIIGTGLCGLIIYLYFIPVGAKTLLFNTPEYEYCYLPWMIFLGITAIPCYLVLICSWRIASEIGKDNSFSKINAGLLKCISGLAAMDSIVLFVGSTVFYILKMSHSVLMLLCILIVFVGIAVTVAAAALSHLVYKAATMKEESELTI
jgi:hypothetical protein